MDPREPCDQQTIGQPIEAEVWKKKEPRVTIDKHISNELRFTQHQNHFGLGQTLTGRNAGVKCKKNPIVCQSK